MLPLPIWPPASGSAAGRKFRIELIDVFLSKKRLLRDLSRILQILKFIPNELASIHHHNRRWIYLNLLMLLGPDRKWNIIWIDESWRTETSTRPSKLWLFQVSLQTVQLGSRTCHDSHSPLLASAGIVEAIPICMQTHIRTRTMAARHRMSCFSIKFVGIWVNFICIIFAIDFFHRPLMSDAVLLLTLYATISYKIFIGLNCLVSWSCSLSVHKFLLGSLKWDKSKNNIWRWSSWNSI